MRTWNRNRPRRFSRPRRRFARHRRRGFGSMRGFRRNPDHGPTLYNPLEDKNHPFKNDSAYKKIIKSFYSKKRRRNPSPFNYGAGEDTQQGLFRSLFQRRRHMSRRNPYRHRRNPEEGRGLFKSLFARRRRNPLGYTFEEGRGLYKSIFSRRNLRRRNPRRRFRNPDPNTQIFSQDIFARRRGRHRHRHNPVDTYDTWDYYWDRGRV